MNLLLTNLPPLTEAQISAMVAIARPPTEATITGLEQAARYLTGRPVERDTSPVEDRKTRFQAMIDRMIPPFRGPVTPLPPDHLTETKQFRREIGAILDRLRLAAGDEVKGDARDYRGCRDSDERLQAVTKLKEALFWLAEDLKQINLENNENARPSRHPRPVVLHPIA